MSESTPAWIHGYGQWENIANPATPGETVAEAEAAERDGWPYPVSGDATARYRYRWPKRAA